MSVPTYISGTVVRCRGLFTLADGTPNDPGGVSFIARSKSGVELQEWYPGAIVKDATGDYYIDIQVETPGMWFFRFEGTTSGQAAGEDQFRVKASRVN